MTYRYRTADLLIGYIMILMSRQKQKQKQKKSFLVDKEGIGVGWGGSLSKLNKGVRILSKDL